MKKTKYVEMKVCGDFGKKALGANFITAAMANF
jgi:hypothetical protein